MPRSGETHRVSSWVTDPCGEVDSVRTMTFHVGQLLPLASVTVSCPTKLMSVFPDPSSSLHFQFCVGNRSALGGMRVISMGGSNTQVISPTGVSVLRDTSRTRLASHLVRTVVMPGRSVLLDSAVLMSPLCESSTVTSASSAYGSGDATGLKGSVDWPSRS